MYEVKYNGKTISKKKRKAFNWKLSAEARSKLLKIKVL